MTTDYAWTITADHLDGPESTDIGISGPSNAPIELLDRVRNGEGNVFYLYDDDGERYYTGRLFTTGEPDTEAHCFAPLDDFGMGWAGCTEVRWHGHPSWTCG